MKLEIYPVKGINYFTNYLIVKKPFELKNQIGFNSKFNYKNINLNVGDKVTKILDYIHFDSPTGFIFQGSLITSENRLALLFQYSTIPLDSVSGDNLEYPVIFFNQEKEVWYLLKKHFAIEDMFEVGREYKLFPITINGNEIDNKIENKNFGFQPEIKLTGSSKQLDLFSPMENNIYGGLIK
ncbi:MAG: hypothetical protein KDK36_12830 [Leptospiraceae bacterium]|nr:hypothetical protein [Leptospiraceae bacterium]